MDTLDMLAIISIANILKEPWSLWYFMVQKIFMLEFT